MTSVMLLFGSGGHSTEMLMLLRNAKLEQKLGSNKTSKTGVDKLVCVISDDDSFIQPKIEARFSKFGDKIEIDMLKRPRGIRQSYLTSIWTFLIVLYSSFCIVRRRKPKLCLTNGPGLSVTILLAIRFMQLLDWRYKCYVLFVESFCRTKTLSLSGKLVYHLRLSDEFYVQWPELAEIYPRVRYKGTD